MTSFFLVVGSREAIRSELNREDETSAGNHRKLCYTFRKENAMYWPGMSDYANDTLEVVWLA